MKKYLGLEKLSDAFRKLVPKKGKAREKRENLWEIYNVENVTERRRKLMVALQAPGIIYVPYENKFVDIAEGVVRTVGPSYFEEEILPPIKLKEMEELKSYRERCKRLTQILPIPQDAYVSAYWKDGSLCVIRIKNKNNGKPKTGPVISFRDESGEKKHVIYYGGPWLKGPANETFSGREVGILRNPKTTALVRYLYKDLKQKLAPTGVVVKYNTAKQYPRKTKQGFFRIISVEEERIPDIRTHEFPVLNIVPTEKYMDITEKYIPKTISVELPTDIKILEEFLAECLTSPTYL
ncbi:MAG: hypothetical protein B6U68_04350 [Candidatus Aenigmarchaeota archaeon ex4484_14]|nr:MAG: hypothetical protein B6U68_04350 [Candidatus Aenigmarchaeota archaeon ex4484_14]